MMRGKTGDDLVEEEKTAQRRRNAENSNQRLCASVRV
jgi:hypothetical protein